MPILTTSENCSPAAVAILAVATFFGEIERVRARGGGDGDDVFAAAPNFRFVVGAQSRVQNGAVFAFVHRLAREHRLAARRQIGGGGQIGEQIDRLFGQRGFRKIEQQIVERERQFFESARIRGEQILRRDCAGFFAVRDQRAPSAALGGGWRDHGFIAAPNFAAAAAFSKIAVGESPASTSHEPPTQTTFGKDK